jgi:hypothetical protein
MFSDLVKKISPKKIKTTLKDQKWRRRLRVLAGLKERKVPLQSTWLSHEKRFLRPLSEGARALPPLRKKLHAASRVSITAPKSTSRRQQRAQCRQETRRDVHVERALNRRH